ncbi:uncharacterized protein LOC114757504 [Neltuma alba]|uniref:uncharacterized protein LOC114757504 n=1 Tax=Neltuma alba TaxID=207710 RepID=UPI0010A4F64B|nr:uncharacterized protein LOC114757504 [Prosopis alba]
MCQSKYDHSVFYQSTSTGIILLVVYVDDIVITGSNMSGISSLKSFLNSHFQTKDLGPLKYFLGIEVLRSKKGILLTQRKYVLDLLKETGKLGAAPNSFPMIYNLLLDTDGSIPSENPVDTAKSKPFENPERQWEALKHVLHYLKGSPSCGILYRNHGHTDIECFCDADHGGSKATRRSTTEYCVFVGGNLVSRRIKKQNMVSQSSADAEYRAMAQLCARSSGLDRYCPDGTGTHLVRMWLRSCGALGIPFL